MIESAISNSAFFIGLERIRRSDLVSRIFREVCVPPAVAAEVQFLPAGVAIVSPSNLGLISALKSQIDDGEAEAIALAVERSNSFLVLDDRKGRRIAMQMGLKVMVTVGILIQAKTDGIISSVRPILDELLDTNFRISDELYEEALRIAGESPA